MFSDDSVYVVFTKANKMGWIRHLLHRNISHCYVVFPDKGKWVVYDQAVNHTSIFTLDNINDILATSIIVKAEANQVGWYYGLNTCVSAVKRLIGINNPFILTPYQLYKRIK